MNRISPNFNNAWSITGAALAVLAILFLISFMLIEALQPSDNPYTGLWTFLLLPTVLVTGLLLIPLGWYLTREKRRKSAEPDEPVHRPLVLDLQDVTHRRGLVIFGLGTMLIIPLIGVSSYQGYHYTESTRFCGGTCHEVMHPEYTSYDGSPHSRVSCAECHIGPGADWFVKSKLSGVRQIFAVAFDTFPRPIPTPIVDLRPARETCEQCHWPAKFFGSQLRSRIHYASDEINTRREIRVLVKTGGADATQGPPSGIHWHMALSHKIEYIAADRSREIIPWVRSTDALGRVTIYRSDGKSSQDAPPPGEVRQVDCLDCHNRPTHIYYPPDWAVNISLETGRMDRTLPYVKKAAVEALTEPYATEEEAHRKIEAYILDFYQRWNPRLADERKSSIFQAIEESRAIYRRNFFPRMKVDWRTYPDHISHMFSDGCFRCHDNEHVSDDKKVIRKDCAVCHELQQPINVPGQTGTYRMGILDHPVKLVGIHAELRCSACHTGGRAPVDDCQTCHARQRMLVQGERPSLPGLEKSPSLLAVHDCESCHDLSKPRSLANVAEQCATCHDKGQGELLALWKDDVDAGRTRALEALDRIGKSLNGRGNGGAAKSATRELVQQLRDAMAELDRAGAIHNPELADAVYQKAVQAADGK